MKTLLMLLFLSPHVFSLGIPLDRESILGRGDAKPIEVYIDYDKTNANPSSISVRRKEKQIVEKNQAILHTLNQLKKITIEWYIKDGLFNDSIVHVRFFNPLNEKVSIYTMENLIRGIAFNSISLTIIEKNKTIELSKLNSSDSIGINIPANGYCDLSFVIKKIQAKDKIIKVILNIEACEIKIGNLMIYGVIWNLRNTKFQKKLLIQSQLNSYPSPLYSK